jgi:hypothetical protein
MLWWIHADGQINLKSPKAGLKMSAISEGRYISDREAIYYMIESGMITSHKIFGQITSF